MFSKTLNTVVKAGIIIGMLAGVGLLVMIFMQILPTARNFFRLEGSPAYFYYLSAVLAVACVAGAEYIAWTLFSMMRSIDSDPFVMRNVLALRHMGIAAIGIAVCGLITLLLHPVPLAVVAALPIGMCGLFSLVLSNVFAKAVAFKEENDLTV